MKQTVVKLELREDGLTSDLANFVLLSLCVILYFIHCIFTPVSGDHAKI
jgi:hypothetical protein